MPELLKCEDVFFQNEGFSDCYSAAILPVIRGGSDIRPVHCTIAEIWNELKKLKDMVHRLETVVVEQRVELRNLETKMRESEVQAEEERSKVLPLTAEPGFMSKKVEVQRADLWVTKKL